MNIEMSKGQFNRMVTDLCRYAKVKHLDIEFVNGAFFAYGSELECLRILSKYHMVDSAKVYYSDNKETFYFKLTLTNFSGEHKNF